jgi:cell volume regulation protein A
MAFDITLTMTYFAFLLGFGVIIANLLKKAKIPDTFFLLLLGLVLSPTVFMNPVVMQYVNVVLVDVSAMGAVPDFLRVLALILVVFTGTFNLSWKVFKRFSDVSVNLAFVGVIFSTAFLGLVAHLMFGLNPVYALLLGAVVGGTGTGVLYAFERALHRSKRALAIIKVESIFNSPLTVLLPLIFLGLVVLEPGALFEPLKYLAQFWQMIAAGVGTGIVIGFAVSKIMKGMLKEYSSLILFSIALITYALAENVGGSGMLAVAICGLIAGNLVMSNKEKEEVKRFEDQLSEMLRISVFTLLGAQVMLPLDPGQLLLAFAFFLVVFFSRPIFLIPTLGKQRKKFDRKDLVLMSFVAPRGLAAAAMAPIVATVLTGIGAPEVGNQMVNIIFLVILFSVLFSTIVALVMSTRYVQDMGREEKPPKPPRPKPEEKPPEPGEPEEPGGEDFLEKAESVE